VKFKNVHYPVIITPSQVAEMTECSQNDCGLCFGGAVTLSEMEQFMKKVIQEQPSTDEENSILKFQKLHNCHY